MRIGNAAYQQLQLDVFGEIADAMFQALKADMAPSERGRTIRPVVLGVSRYSAILGEDCLRRPRSAG